MNIKRKTALVIFIILVYFCGCSRNISNNNKNDNTDNKTNNLNITQNQDNVNQNQNNINNKKEEANVFKNTKQSFNKSDNLQLNIYSKDARRLNYVLKEMGYGTVDSYIFSEKTTNAVKQFQKEKGLPIDGIAGEVTINALNKEIQSKSVVLPNFETKIINSPTSNKWIVINKSCNSLYLINAKKILKEYPITIGSMKYETPEGKYKIANKAVNPAWKKDNNSKIVPGGTKKNPLGFRWMGLNVGNGYQYGIHGTNIPKEISKHVSKGCIRLLNKDIEYIYEQVKEGTEIWIGKDETLKKWGIEEKMY